MTISRIISQGRRCAALVSALALAVAATACRKDVASGECQTDRAQINRPTDGKMLAFAISPQSINYHYVEIHPTDTLVLDWDTTMPYNGMACLRFRTTDSVRVDSTGPFQLVTLADNVGWAWRQRYGQTDSVQVYSIWGCAGDGGTYRLNADSTISFTWRNGQQYKFFGPTGVHRLVSDSVIHTSSEESYRADSTHASWRARWVRAYCGEGF